MNSMNERRSDRAMKRQSDEATKRSTNIFRYSTFAFQCRSLTAAVLMVAVAPAFAQSGGAFEITRSTIASGGGDSSGGGFAVSGTIGQIDVGDLSGGGYTLSGGFWGVAGGIPCSTPAMCVITDNDVCTFDDCTAGFCTNTETEYGNVNGSSNQTPNLDDILCALAGFSGFANCPNADITPACTGNDIINLDDLLAVLAAFGGADPCGCN